MIWCQFSTEFGWDAIYPAVLWPWTWACPWISIIPPLVLICSETFHHGSRDHTLRGGGGEDFFFFFNMISQSDRDKIHDDAACTYVSSDDLV